MNNIIDLTQVTHLRDRIPLSLCRELCDQILATQRVTATVPRSNPGCWRGPCSLSPEQDQIMTDLVTAAANEYILSLPLPQELNRAPMTASQWQYNLWANVNKPGSWNIPHQHGLSMITLVLYLQSTDTGLIRFHPTNFLMKQYQKNWPYNGDWCVDPKDGDMVIFPSYLLHTVEPNPHHSKDRICIAVNAELV